MKKITIIIFCLLFFKLSYSLENDESTSLLIINSTENTQVNLNSNYQQFKHQVINLETNDLIEYAGLKKRRRKQTNDNLMLYVAGGLAVATATLILVNDPDNFTSNSASGVNLGIATGGTVACGLIVAKFFIDRRR